MQTLRIYIQKQCFVPALIVSLHVNQVSFVANVHLYFYRYLIKHHYIQSFLFWGGWEVAKIWLNNVFQLVNIHILMANHVKQKILKIITFINKARQMNEGFIGFMGSKSDVD